MAISSKVNVTGSVITGESRYPLTRITIVGESKDAAPALKWVPPRIQSGVAGTMDYHIHKYSNAIAPSRGEGNA